MSFNRPAPHDERRRRLLADEASGAREPRKADGEADVAPTAAAAPRKAARSRRYGDPSFADGHLRVTDLVPRGYAALSLWFVAGALAIAGIETLYYFMPRLAADGHVPAFDLAGHGHLANWLASAVLLVSSLASLLIYSIRRHKADDYHGRYRIWLWAAAVWLVMSIDETAGLHHGFQGLMVGLTGTRIAADGALWWMLPYGLVLLAIGGRLLFEIRACRTAVAFYALAGLMLGAAVAVHLDSIPYPLPAEYLVMLEEGLELAGDWCLLVSLALFARFTILEAEGGLRHSAKTKRVKQKSAEGRRARDNNENADDESGHTRPRTQASSTGTQLRFDSAQSHGPSDHRRLSKAERRALKRERLRERD
ncbi:MAG: hypothetical protein K2Y37_22055 [Pirellulales bacterium]|nr:hypothetical protein [Pirellulales bacterium]